MRSKTSFKHLILSTGGAVPLKDPKKSLGGLVASVEVKDAGGVTIGSAIVLVTSRVSDKDARRQLDVRICLIRREEPVDGFVRQYFEEIRDKI